MIQNKRTGKSGKPFRFNELWIYAIILAVLGGLFLWDSGFGESKTLSWDEFQRVARNGAFSQITVDRGDKTATGQLTKQAADSIFAQKSPVLGRQQQRVEYTLTTEIPSVDRFSDFYDQSGITAKVTYKESRSGLLTLLINIAPFIIIIIFWNFMLRRSAGGGGGGMTGGGLFSIGKSKAQLYEKEGNVVTFKDVAGLHEAKVEVEEIVHFLKNPAKYTQLGGKIPKGALLVGPPGTGKTLLAKAVAGEAHVPFFSLAGSDFVEMFVGVGASRVRDLFQKAKEKAPCIIFIDEIDAVGRARGKNNNLGGNDERENTLNQLLTEMDGFGTNSGIIVLAATNRADILDSALLRAGRFDRQIYVDLPDVHDRKEIFLVHLRPLKIDDTVDVDLLARRTPGFSGADIANICNEAALIAARAGKDFISREDFMNAIDRVVGGLEKKNKMTTEEERHSIALHEAGHATVSWFLKYANPLVKVTIVPRGKALGAAWYLPEERQITTTQALRDQMCATLAGRAAEEVFLGRISTGAANDLEHTTKTAYAMVAYYGMSDKLPNVNYYDMQGDGYGITKPYSDRTAELIDQEAREIVHLEYERAKELLREHAEGLKALTQLLLDREVIYTEDVEHIFGKRAWVSRTEELILANEEAKSPSTEQGPDEAPSPTTSTTEAEVNTQ
ncbi:ATP-dependent metallopeptidase HflB [Porphyromonas sp. oral taxon 278 str. W7784]|uniref:ATP-dependent zinc metalloprotease FtsH n=2 Tax=Porphyromonas TaxID=836 RepID=UPI0003AD0FBD|nr:ATP-dependent zinc metalloprotease FtsH [Porphyromonas sp. oral taxon 278]ERJ72553.1 ATP-dependent metallopeptidase HflB [Porphyromonas sp. oral taxon 278 str. W7784]